MIKVGRDKVCSRMNQLSISVMVLADRKGNNKGIYLEKNDFCEEGREMGRTFGGWRKND